MLLGRDTEQSRIEQVLAAARLGSSACLILHGEAGVGKTRLLGFATEQAATMRVLSARGVQFEADVPFAGLHELLRPALADLDRLTDSASRALRASLGVGERVETDRLLVGAATLDLLTIWAERGPLLVVIDDAQWLDRASAEALAFTVRRLLADPIAVLVAIRAGEDSPLLEANLPRLEVGGLDAAAAGLLLEISAGRRPSTQLVERLMEATGGNPLALVELAGEVDHLPPAATGRPLPVATTVERAYLRRIASLPPATREVLLLLAAAGTEDFDALGAAAVRLGLEPAAVDDMEASGGIVTTRGGRLDFVHPLARAAVYHSTPAASRRRVHAALAEVTGNPDRRAWHLAAATPGADEGAAAALAEAGARARARTAYWVATAAYEEAARLSTDPVGRADRLLEAAENAWLGGQAGRALELLGAARGGQGAEERSARLDGLGARIAAGQGDFEDGFRLARSAAWSLQSSDPAAASRLLAEAVVVSMGSGRVADMLESGRRALDLAGPGGGRPAAYAHAAYGAAAILAGLGAEGPAHLRLAAAAFGPNPELGDDAPGLMCAAIVGLFLREADAGRDLLELAVAGARERAPTAALPAVLFYLARDAATTERWTAARAGYEESIRMARETQQATWLGAALAALAWLDALEGREHEFRSHFHEARDLTQRLRMDMYGAWALIAEGIFELSAGRMESAHQCLADVRETLIAIRVTDPDIDPTPDLVEVLVRLGRLQEATRPAALHLDAAVAKNQPFALARAHRAAALLAAEDEYASLFAESLRYHAQTPDSFEEARTRLCFGERLRRSRKRAEARHHLSSAVTVFDAVGAAGWSRRALVELGAAGEHGRERGPALRHRLTPQELQIGLALAEGGTVREVAAKLFISPKTVEYHLRNVYDKLEVRTREGLRAGLGSGLSPVRAAPDEGGSAAPGTARR